MFLLLFLCFLLTAAPASAKNQPAVNQSGKQSLQQQTPILDDGSLKDGADSTQLQGGTGATQLQGGTNSTQLQGEAKLNTITIQDWQKMDLKGFTNQARLMPAIPATVRFVAASAKLDDDILKAKTTRLDEGIDQNGERVRVMVHLVRCPPADPGMRAMWMAFEREMSNNGEAWQRWEEKLQEAATSIWQKNASGEGAISFHLVVDENFNILEISDQSDNKFATDELEKSARRTLELLRKSAGRFPSYGISRVHIRVSFIRGLRS